MGGGEVAAALDAPTLTADEQRLVDTVAARRDDIVALLRELIGYDTTSRGRPDQPARDEAKLQRALADRLATHGAEVDLWEPAPGDVAGHPLSVEGIGFDGRPQLAARLRGSGGGRSLLLNGHIDQRPTSRARSHARWRARPACRGSSSPWAATAASRGRCSSACTASTAPR